MKLWSTGMEHSVSCIEAKANVCCVKFNPESRYHLAFGSAGKNQTITTFKILKEKLSVIISCVYIFLAKSHALYSDV